VYALGVMFMTDGPRDEYQAAEWIHQAYRLTQRTQHRSPHLAFVAPLERMLQAPDEVLPAFESLLADDDPWVRALARLHLGKMRIVLGQGGRDADAYLEMAVAEFRGLGERWGISFAQTELAGRIATRGEFAAASEHYEEAIAVAIELGAIDDVVQWRSRQAQLYWLLGDEESSTAAMAEAKRYAERVVWPSALAALALAKAELARWSGDTEQAFRQLDVATALLGDEAEQALFRAMTHDLLGYLADGLDEAREHRIVAFQAATEAGHPSLIAHVLVGIADLALRRGQFEQAARLLAASASLRGLPDRSKPDEDRIEQDARRRLGEARFAEATQEGALAIWPELAEATLAC
jgi:tetratricopeptide (TPR) repeat protein